MAKEVQALLSNSGILETSAVGLDRVQQYVEKPVEVNFPFCPTPKSVRFWSNFAFMSLMIIDFCSRSHFVHVMF